MGTVCGATGGPAAESSQPWLEWGRVSTWELQCPPSERTGCVCVRDCIHVCTSAHACVFARGSLHTRVHVCKWLTHSPRVGMSMHVSLYVCTHERACRGLYVHVCECVRVCACLCVCVCMCAGVG